VIKKIPITKETLIDMIDSMLSQDDRLAKRAHKCKDPRMEIRWLEKARSLMRNDLEYVRNCIRDGSAVTEIVVGVPNGESVLEKP
jgi:hypothetical protein